MPKACDVIRSSEELQRHVLTTRLAMRPGSEIIVAEVSGWPCADYYINPLGDASLVGAIMRLYAVADAARVLESQRTIGAVNQSYRCSASGRGVTKWEATLQLATGAAASTLVGGISATLISFASGGGSTPAGVAPSGAGIATWYDVGSPLLAAGVIKAAPGQLLQIFGNSDSGNANSRWIHVFDKATAPVLGDVPFLRAFVPVGSFFSFDLTNVSDLNPGRALNNGIAWGVSSTSATFTQAAELFDVHAKFL